MRGAALETFISVRRHLSSEWFKDRPVSARAPSSPRCLSTEDSLARSLMPGSVYAERVLACCPGTERPGDAHRVDRLAPANAAEASLTSPGTAATIAVALARSSPSVHTKDLVWCRTRLTMDQPPLDLSADDFRTVKEDRGR